jgi:radical SAM protein with 4Fe4S-binding SPASM domain
MTDFLKDYNVLGMYDLADITFSPDKVYQILNQHRKDTFLPNERIVFYSQFEPSNELLKHILDATLLIDIDSLFVLICCSVDIQSKLNDVCQNNNPFSFLQAELNSLPLGNSFTLPDTLCPIPWTTLEIRHTGKIFPCCMSSKSATVGDIKTGLQETFMNSNMIQLRQEFTSGIKPSGCNNCWTRESQGLITNRIRHRNYMLKDLLIQGLDNPKLKQLDLKFGLTCNFKCRICSPGSSSAFAEEDAKFKNIKFVLDSNWAEDSLHLSKIIELLPDLDNIDMYGGEPFLLKSFAQVLKIAVEQGYAKGIRLHYNTNGSIYPKELIKYWPEFREVDIHFSIDVLGDKFKLERGSTWKEVEANILRIKNLNLPNLKLAVMPAVSVMNIYYLDEVLSWAKSHNFVVNPQHVVNPAGYSLSQLTREAKNLIIKKFKNHPWPEMQKILENIKRLPDSNGEEFIKLTHHFDKLRNENFADNHPEIAKAMGYVYNQ